MPSSAQEMHNFLRTSKIGRAREKLTRAIHNKLRMEAEATRTHNEFRRIRDAAAVPAGGEDPPAVARAREVAQAAQLALTDAEVNEERAREELIELEGANERGGRRGGGRRRVKKSKKHMRSRVKRRRSHKTKKSA